MRVWDVVCGGSNQDFVEGRSEGHRPRSSGFLSVLQQQFVVEFTTPSKLYKHCLPSSQESSAVTMWLRVASWVAGLPGESL